MFQSMLTPPPPGPLFNNYFMYWYSWPIAKVLFVSLNCTLNPILYVYRMTEFRTWIITRGTLMTSFLDSLKSENNVEMPPVDKTKVQPELNPKNIEDELDNSK